MDDEDLLQIVRDECRRSIGFDHDSELTAERERALEYYKGVMTDVPSMANRSKAVSSDVHDVVETILPDLVEIFTGGDDVATFIPRGPEDEEAAQQESDYINHIVFQQNGGFLTLYSMFKDALQVKTGVVKFYWEKYDDELEELKGKTQEEAIVASQSSEIVAVSPSDESTPEAPLYDLTIRKPGPPGKICIDPIPPEDFTVGADTVSLADATYCAMRTRKRAQDLIVQGIDPDVIDRLPAYTSHDEEMEMARDTVGESNTPRGEASANLRLVEIVEHFVRLEEGGKLQLWRVLTGGGETVLIEKERVEFIQYAAITPFIVTHRFYGESVADQVLEIQKIKTAVMRGYLDSIYFALNQRNEVDMSKANEYTIGDLLRNEPGVPIRVKMGGAVTPVQAGGAGFSGLDALEYFSTVSEQRTGVVRAAQGLNPDTLHDTAKGALALISQAQKRVRLIARIFAETGVKDLFLGVHALVRQHSSQGQMVRLRGKWVQADPSTWGSRADLSIEIGLGSAGKDQAMISLGQIAAGQEKIIQLQGGAMGPIVTYDNVYALAKKLAETGGSKAPELFFNDPQGAMPQPAPDPKAAEAQAKQQEAQMALQVQASKNQGELQLANAKAASEAQLQQAKTQSDAEAAMQRLQMETALKRETADRELALKERQLNAELMLKERIAVAELALKEKQGAYAPKPSSDIGQVSVGGTPG